MPEKKVEAGIDGQYSTSRLDVSSELPCQQLLKHHLFYVSFAPADADFQREVNGHFFIQNQSETRAAGI